jgi:hypothetical protein
VNTAHLALFRLNSALVSLYAGTGNLEADVALDSRSDSLICRSDGLIVPCGRCLFQPRRALFVLWTTERAFRFYSETTG